MKQRVLDGREELRPIKIVPMVMNRTSGMKNNATEGNCTHCYLTLKQPGGPYGPLSPKFQFYFKKGLSKKIPMSVAPMSR